MTKEEAKEIFLNRGYVEVDGGIVYDANKWREACRVISEWLEQEPCEDAISRQAVINAIANTCFWLSADNWEELIKCINSIPPVTPVRKKGKWLSAEEYALRIGAEVTEDDKKSLYRFCPFCEQAVFMERNFCPNCGAEMEG